MMSNEEFDRRMEFFLKQQAQFDADMAEMKKHHAEIDKKLDRTVETVSSLTTLVFEGFKITDAKIQALAESQKQLQKDLAESHKELRKELAESQKLTDEKLRDLTVLMDRHIREGHHGSVN